MSYGLFPLPDSDSDSDSYSDSKPYGYIELCRTCFHCTDLDSDWDLDPFPKWLLYPFQGQISIPRTDLHPFSIRGSGSESEPMEKSCVGQESVSESESESESGNGNKPLFYQRNKRIGKECIVCRGCTGCRLQRVLFQRTPGEKEQIFFSLPIDISV